MFPFLFFREGFLILQINERIKTMANIDYSIGMNTAARFNRSRESKKLQRLPINPEKTIRDGFVIQKSFGKCNVSLNAGGDLYSKLYHIELYEFLATLTYLDLVEFTGFTL